MGLVYTKESPKGQHTMIEIVGILQNIKDNLCRVAIIPKLQSDITHFIGSTSTSHNKLGERQRYYTF